MPETNNPPETPEFISKTQQKNYARSMQDLAHILLDGSPEWLASLPLTQKIRDVIKKTRRIKSHIAKKREIQYLAKLLLHHEPENILAAIDRHRAEEKARSARVDTLQRWVDALLDDPVRLEELYTSANPQQVHALRQQLRQCLKTHHPDKRLRRKLFEALRDLDLEAPLPPP